MNHKTKGYTNIWLQHSNNKKETLVILQNFDGLKVCVCVCVRPGLLCEGVNSRVIHTRDSAPSSLTQRHWGINSVLSDPSGDMPILGVSIQHAEKQHTQSRCPQDTGAQNHDRYNLDFGHLRARLNVICTYSLIKVQKTVRKW